MLITGKKKDLFLGNKENKHRVMTPYQKKWKKVVKAFCITIAYETVKEVSNLVTLLNHMRNVLQLYYSLLSLQSWSSVVTSR